MITTTKGEMDESLLEKREGSLDNDTDTEPTPPVAALPVMAMDKVSPTVPTLPVAIVPSSWTDLSVSNVPAAPVAWLPLMTTLPMP